MDYGWYGDLEYWGEPDDDTSGVAPRVVRPDSEEWKKTWGTIQPWDEQLDETKVLRKIKKFLDNGADINCTDGLGETILSKVTTWTLLANPDPKIDDTHPKMLPFKSGKVFHFLLENGANPNCNRSDMPLLNSVADDLLFSIAPHLVETLLRYGAKPNGVDREGNTPLHKTVVCIASKSPKINVISLLLARGANEKLKNKIGLTPIDLLDDKSELGAILRGAEISRELGEFKKQHAKGKGLATLLSEQDRKEIEDDEKVVLAREKRKTAIEQALEETEKLKGKEKRKAELAILKKTDVQKWRDEEGKARSRKMASILKKKQNTK